MKVRKVIKTDLKEIANLMLREFSKEPFNEATSLNSILRSLNYYFKIGIGFVATVDNEIIGVVIFKIEQFWEGKVILIEDLAVNKKFKKDGIERKLLDKIDEYAKKKNIVSISFITHKKSKSINTYKNRGFIIEKHNVILRKDVSK